MSQKPSVGRIVLFTDYEDEVEGAAAIVTAVCDDGLSLFVFAPATVGLVRARIQEFSDEDNSKQVRFWTWPPRT